MKTNEQHDDKVTINILEKTFQIKCPEEKINDLRHAAEYLNKEMRKMRHSGVVGMERLAIISALNICHSLLAAEHQRDQYVHNTTSRIRELEARIDKSLADAAAVQLEFSLDKNEQISVE